MAITIANPVTRQVIQRQGNNTAVLTIAGSVTGAVTEVQAMAAVMAGGSGTSTPWITIDSSVSGGLYSGGLTLAAGGWYSISVRSMNGGTVVDTATVSKVGVGEVFILCGQSNSVNSGQTITTPTDDRVSAANYVNNTWQFAVDPQPDPLGGGSSTGSVWPTAFSEIVSSLDMSVGLLMTGFGGTSVANWLPGGALFLRLEMTLQYVGVNGARSILWCQGEADTQLGTSEAAYQSNLSTIIAATRSYAQWDVPWMVSQTSYISGQTSAAVIAAQQAVVNGIDILAGPYTDQYGSAYRYDNTHFNLSGQLAVGGDWACDILLESIYPIQWIDPQNGIYLKRTVSEFLGMKKSVSQATAQVGDVLTYTISLSNNSGGPLSSLTVLDAPSSGASFLPGSLIIGGQPSPLSPAAGFLLASLGIGQMITFTFQAVVTEILPVGAITNRAAATFGYSTCNPPKGTSVSNTVVTKTAVSVLKSAYSQQISDLIHSIALEEAAIGNIANAEGAKLQRLLALGVTANELLCVNKSITQMLEALGTLESVLKQKLGAVDCQISSTCM